MFLHLLTITSINWPVAITLLLHSQHIWACVYLYYIRGSTEYGQLGNPLSDGKLPCLVQEVGEFVIACSAYHIAVLTSRSEVYTWVLMEDWDMVTARIGGHLPLLIELRH